MRFVVLCQFRWIKLIEKVSKLWMQNNRNNLLIIDARIKASHKMHLQMNTEKWCEFVRYYDVMMMSADVNGNNKVNIKIYKYSDVYGHTNVTTAFSRNWKYMEISW